MESKTSLAGNLKTLYILFTTLFTGIIVFTGVSLILNRINGPFLQNEKFSQIFLVIVIVLSVIGLFFAHAIYNKRMRPEFLSSLPLSEKLNHYRLSLTSYMAFLEGPALFSIIGFLLTGNFRFLAITIILLLNMLLKRPSKMRMVNDLQLSSAEQSELI